MKLSKLIISTALIIFNHIILSNCTIFLGGRGFNNSFFTGDKLYYLRINTDEFFYIDLTGI